jgi:hypothetical protein
MFHLIIKWSCLGYGAVKIGQLKRLRRRRLTRTKLVSVPPMLSIPNQLEAAFVGQDVSLECHTEAYPTSLNYWITERGDMIVSGEHLLLLFFNQPESVS